VSRNLVRIQPNPHGIFAAALELHVTRLHRL
jgi:hypothetical protein